MGASLIQMGATISCPHAGQVSAVSGNPRVRLGGQPVTTMADTFVVGGCPFVVGNKPQPCVQVQWLTVSNRVKVGRQPVILQDSFGLCKSVEQIPQGKVMPFAVQGRVKGV